MSIEDYRLTAEDESRVKTVIAGEVARWRNWGTISLAAGAAFETLRRIGFSTLGCAEWDLRDSEIEWVEAQVREVLA
jgi:hypothetical protein